MSATLHTAGHFHTMCLPVVDFTHLEHTARSVVHTLRNIVLFLAAPFIGLVYALALPVVGLIMLAIIGMRAMGQLPAAHRAWIAVRHTALLATAPLLGLVFALALPLAGTFMLIRIAFQAYRAPAQTA